jgi:hypothetical protein
MNSFEGKIAKLVGSKFENVVKNANNFTAGILAMFFLLLILALFGGLVLYGIWVTAFVSTYLWLWFVVPVFHVAPLTLLQAYGLAILVTYWTHQHISDKVEDTRKPSVIVAELVGLFLKPWVTLLVGYIIYRLM